MKTKLQITVVMLMTCAPLFAQVNVKLTTKTHLLSEPNQATFNNDNVLPSGQILQITGYVNGYYTASQADTNVYVYYPYLSDVPEAVALKDKWDREFAAKKKRERLDNLVRRFGEEDGRKLFENRIWLGMTPQMARASTGSPKSINSTETAYGTREQWVYEDKYLYFEDEKLTAIQETKKN